MAPTAYRSSAACRCPETARRRASGAGSCGHGPRCRCLLPGRRHAGRALRRPVLHRRQDDRHLLPPGLPGADAEAGERHLLPVAPRRRRRRASARACAAGRRRRPTSAVWRGTSNTVSRALALIEEGALDGDDVEALADRLGVGERQLRRLFRQHLGASPIAVAQTRRVLLAKQLIDETRLPMTQVALAAGFGSVRRFNETFQRLYGRPPSTLRRGGAGEIAAHRRRRDPPALPPAVRLAGHARVPRRARDPGRRGRHVRHLHAHHRRRRRARHRHGAAHRRPGAESHDPVPGALGAAGNRRAAAARVRPGGGPGADRRAPGRGSRPRAARRGPARAAGGRRLGRLRARGSRPARAADHGAARCGWRRAWSPRSEHRCRARTAPRTGSPTSSRIPTSSPIAISRASASPGRGPRRSPPWRERCATRPDIFGPRRSLDETIRTLRTLPGIGEWTAQYIAMREMREPDAFPAADVGLLRAMADGHGRRPSARELLARAEPWRPWRAYAAQHLWASG